MMAPAADGCKPCWAAVSDWRCAPAAWMPERHNLELLWLFCDAVVDVVPNSGEVQAANAYQREVSGACANMGLHGEKTGDSLDLLPDGVWRLRPVESPPRLGLANLFGCELADLDVQRLAHSRLRSSPRS